MRRVVDFQRVEENEDSKKLLKFGDVGDDVVSGGSVELLVPKLLLEKLVCLCYSDAS